MLSLLFFAFTAAAGQSYGFLAVEFFETRADDIRLKSNWPERLTLTPIEAKDEELKELMPGIWRVFVACSGRALSVREVERTDYADGVGRNSVTTTYFEDGRYERVAHRGRRQNEEIPAREVINQGRWVITITDAQRGLFQADTVSAGVVPSTFQLMEIEETGEHLLIDTNEQVDEAFRGLCRRGERPQQVFAKLPMS